MVDWKQFVRSVWAVVRGQRVSVLLAAGAVVLGVWMFAEIADEVVEADTQTFDERIVQAFRDPGDPSRLRGPGWVETMTRDISALGGFIVLILMTGAVTGFLLLTGRRQSAVLVVVAVVGGVLVGVALKSGFDRPRPSVVPHKDVAQLTSFPSGHSMMSATVYLTLGALLAQVSARRSLKVYFLMTAMLLTGLVGVSRVALGVHYPTDVLAGWSAGLAWALLCWLVAYAVRRRPGHAEPDYGGPNG